MNQVSKASFKALERPCFFSLKCVYYVQVCLNAGGPQLESTNDFY